MILCCDTSTDHAVFALGDYDGHLLASSVKHHHRDLSVQFFNDLGSVLYTAGAVFADVTVLAVGLGPGSFTGVRVAVTTLRTLAQATGKLLVGIGTLDALALGAGASDGSVIAILPSRRGEVYCAVYRNGKVERGPFAATFAELTESIAECDPTGPLTTIGPVGILPAEFGHIPHIAAACPDPEALLELASLEARAGAWADPLALNPVYVVAPAVNQHRDPRTAERLRGVGAQH